MRYSAMRNMPPTILKKRFKAGRSRLHCAPTFPSGRCLPALQREKYVETDYSERETGHFVLHYEGAQSSEALRGQILETMESAYQDLRENLAVNRDPVFRLFSTPIRLFSM